MSASRAALAALITTLLAGTGLLLGAGVAGAHAYVTDSNPADGASLSSGPDRATVKFNEPLQTQFATLTVVGPDGNLWSETQPQVDGPTISVALRPLGPTGTYTIGFRVTSADGHVVSGTRTFTLTTAGTGTPGPKPGADKEDSGSSRIPTWPFVVGAVVLFAGGLMFALRPTRKR